jgi:excisionase family DNA binding protein
LNSDEPLVAHLTRALITHKSWCRSRGIAFPALLDTFLAALIAIVGQQRPINGQDRPKFGELPNLAENDLVPTPLLLDDRAAAQRLGVSARTVRRLRANGALPSVRAGKRRLIRVTDVEAFVQNGGAG